MVEEVVSWELGVENRGHDFDLEGRGYEAGSWSMVNDLSQHLSAIMSSSQHYSQPQAETFGDGNERLDERYWWQ